MSRALARRKGRRPVLGWGSQTKGREGGERPGAGGARLRERRGARERTPGARKWVLGALEEVGESWGVVGDTPFGATASHSLQGGERGGAGIVWGPEYRGSPWPDQTQQQPRKHSLPVRPAPVELVPC